MSSLSCKTTICTFKLSEAKSLLKDNRRKEELKSQVPEDVWAASLEPVQKSHNTEERRGQRYRSGKGGARTSLKKSIQRNMNIVREIPF